MSQFNEILEGKLNQLLAARFAMQTGTPSPTLAPEIMPVVVLESDRPEWARLRQELPFGGSGTVAGVAATNSWVALRNPAGSRILATILGAIASTEVAASIIQTSRIIASSGFTPDSTVGGQLLYGGTVEPGTRVSQARIEVGTDALVEAAVGLQWRWRSATLSERVDVLLQPIVLWPGSTWLIYADAADSDLFVNLAWRERVLTGGELV